MNGGTGGWAKQRLAGPGGVLGLGVAGLRLRGRRARKEARSFEAARLVGAAQASLVRVGAGAVRNAARVASARRRPRQAWPTLRPHGRREGERTAGAPQLAATRRRPSQRPCAQRQTRLRPWPPWTAGSRWRAGRRAGTASRVSAPAQLDSTLPNEAVQDQTRPEQDEA